MTIAERRERIEEKITRIQDKLYAAEEELEALQAECSHPRVEWHQTTCLNIDDFKCEECGFYDTRVHDWQRAIP